MRFNININQVQCIKFDLNANQGALMDLIGQLNTWADAENIEGKTYYNLAYSKVIAELPLMFKTPDRVYRNLKVLDKSGLIELLKVGRMKKNFIRLTPKGKLYFSVGKNTETESVSGKKPSSVGKNTETQKEGLLAEIQVVAESVSGKKPTYNNNTTNNIQTKEVLELKLLAENVGNYFGKTTEEQQMKVYGFLKTLKNKLPEFETQFKAYKKYKASSKEKIHRFETFCTGWNEQNWSVMLKNSEAIKEPVQPAYLSKVS